MNNHVGGIPNFSQMLSQLKSNPAQFLMQRRFNVPQSVANDPQAILNHLMQTGQINQNQVNQAYQMLQQFKR